MQTGGQHFNTPLYHSNLLFRTVNVCSCCVYNDKSKLNYLSLVINLLQYVFLPKSG